MSSSSSSDINTLNTVQQYIHCVYIIILTTGVIGNTLNILIFSSLKLFHGNQCAFYLNVESMVNIAALIYAFVDIITHYSNGNDLADYSLAWCKIRAVLDQMAQLIPFSIICFVAFDQILSTSHRYNLRQMSTLKLAQRLVFIAICLATIHSIPAIFFLGIFPPIGCITNDINAGYYYLFFYYPILVGILPIFISSLFSLLAFRNVRHIIRRQVPIIRRRLDRQLTAMVFMRVIVLVVLYSPYVVYRIYTLNLLVSSKYDIPFLFDQLMQITVVLLQDINYAVRCFLYRYYMIPGFVFFQITCYIFLASSPRFRRQMKYFLTKKCLRQWKKCCHFRQNQIHPMQESPPMSSI